MVTLAYVNIWNQRDVVAHWPDYAKPLDIPGPIIKEIASTLLIK